jgi:hypothetical protein
MSRGQVVQRPRQRGGGGCLGCLTGCLSGLMLLGLALACMVGGFYLYIRENAPDAPIANFTPQPQQAQEFEQVIEQAAAEVREAQQSAPGQPASFEVSFTEAQASSWLNLEAPLILDAALPVQNIQARFRDNRTAVYMEVDTGAMVAGTEVDVTYTIGSDGRAQVQVGEINFGGIGLGSQLRNELNQEIQNAINNELDKVSSTYRISEIRSQDGVLIIRGSVS